VIDEDVLDADGCCWMLMDEKDCLCGINHRYIYAASWTAIDSRT
jgi:hypothetical protein